MIMKPTCVSSVICGFLLLSRTVEGQGPGKPTQMVQRQRSLGCEPSVAALQRLANERWTATHDVDRVLAAVDMAIGDGAADTWTFVNSPEGLLFTVSVPARRYRFNLSEALRKREAIASVSTQ